MDADQTPTGAQEAVGEPPPQANEEAPERRRRSLPRHQGHSRRRRSWVVVLALTVASGVGGAIAGCHPTGTPIVDPLYAGLLAALVTLASSRASRASLLILAAAGLALSRGWLLLPGAVALLLAFGSVFPRRQRQRVGALTGALAVQVVLRWPRFGFHGLTALIAGAAIAVCLVSAYTHLSTGRRRWARRSALGVLALFIICAVPAAVGILLAHASADRGIAATDSAVTSVFGGSTSPAVSRLTQATTDFSTASDRAGSWWSSEAVLVPVVAQQRRAIAGAAKAGRLVTATTAAVAGSINISHLAFSDGRFDLTRIRQLAAPIARIQTSLAAAHRRLGALQSAWLVGPLDKRLISLDARLTRVQATARLAGEVVHIAPGILGANGERHYFIAFMTPSESRGLDGFIGAYGELRVKDGRIRLVRAGSVTKLNQAPDGTRHISGPADYLARYGNFHPNDFFQDLSFSPDFPTVEQVIAEMYPQSGGNHIDGVLALDPYALAAMLELTGPVSVPGLTTPLTSTNAADFLLNGQYLKFGNANAARHDFLQEALAAAFRRLVTGPLPSPGTLEHDFAPIVKAGRLLFWTDQPAEQNVLRGLSVSGAFPRAGGGDLLAVTTQNAGGNKLDVYLHRSIDDQVRFDPGTGQTTATVSISLRNDAPTHGLPRVVGGSYAGSGLPPGTNRTWLSVYTPLGFLGGTEDGAALPMGSVRELGVNTYSAYVDIGPGQTVTLRLRLSGRLRASTTYQLSIRNQPLVNPVNMTIGVSPTAGWTVRVTHALGPLGDQNQQMTTYFAHSP